MDNLANQRPQNPTSLWTAQPIEQTIESIVEEKITEPMVYKKSKLFVSWIINDGLIYEKN